MKLFRRYVTLLPLHEVLKNLAWIVHVTCVWVQTVCFSHRSWSCSLCPPCWFPWSSSEASVIQPVSPSGWLKLYTSRNMLGTNVRIVLGELRQAVICFHQALSLHSEQLLPGVKLQGPWHLPGGETAESSGWRNPVSKWLEPPLSGQDRRVLGYWQTLLHYSAVFNFRSRSDLSTLTQGFYN